MTELSEQPFNITDEYRDLPVDEIKTIVMNKALQYDIMALNIQSCLNIGNMMRSANLCGVRKFIIFGRRKYNSRGCVGAQNYINFERVNAIRDADKRNFETLKVEDDDYILDENIFIDYIRENNYLPVFIEQDKYSKIATIEEIEGIIQRSENLDKIPLFILGNESYGIPKNILDTRMKLGLSYTLELKQMGCIRSFNVANCCSILCYKIMETFDVLHTHRRMSK